MEAIHLLQTLEKEERLATPEEQEILSRYVGWGGIPQAFEENNIAANEYLEQRIPYHQKNTVQQGHRPLMRFFLYVLTVIRSMYGDWKIWD